MDWHSVAMTALYATSITIAYLAIGIGMFQEDPMDTIWDRLTVVLWPIAAMFGILWAVGRILKAVTMWGFRTN